MSQVDKNIFKREIFNKISIKVFDRFQFTLQNDELIQKIRDVIIFYFNAQEKDFKFKFEDLLLQEQYEDNFQEFNDVLQESRENSFEEIFELMLHELSTDQDFLKTLNKVCQNNSMQNFLQQINLYFIYQFEKILSQKEQKQKQQDLEETLIKLTEDIKSQFNNSLFKEKFKQEKKNFQEITQQKINKNFQASFNESSNQSLLNQENQLRIFLNNIQDQIQKLNQKKFSQQKQSLEETFKNFMQSKQTNQKYFRENQVVNDDKKFNGFLPFENVYKLKKSDEKTKRQSQIFTIEQVQYDQTEENDDNQSSDFQESLNSQETNKLKTNQMSNPDLLRLVEFCQSIQKNLISNKSVKNSIFKLIDNIKNQNFDTLRNKMNYFITEKIENIQIGYSQQFLNMKGKFYKILENLNRYILHLQQYGSLKLKNIKSVTNISQDINTKYEKLEEENQSLRLVLKTYEDINQLDKDEDSFDIKEDKVIEKKNFTNDYYGYDQGGLEAVQEENSQYESNDSRSNVVINVNKKRIKRVINQSYDYIYEKQLDLFKEKSTSKKNKIFSTQKSQKSIFDHENILNQLDFEHKRYSKRSISLPRLASRKIKKSVKKLTNQSRLFKLNVRIEKILGQFKKITKKETKLRLNVNRLVNTIKLNQGSNQQFADYISEQPYFIDDNAFQNNLEVQMDYTNDNSIRFQNRKSTNKVNTRDSLRANKQRYSTQPSGTIFQLEENNKDLQKSNLELKENLKIEQQKNSEILSNLNQILQNYLDYEDSLPNDIIDSLSIIVNRIDQLKIYISQQQNLNPSISNQNQNILMVLQEQISTCENQQAASMNNLNYLYSQVQDENLGQIVENQLNINNALLTSIKKINDNYYQLISTQKEDQVQSKDLQIETLYKGEDQDNSDKNSYDSDDMNQFAQNINTNNYDVIENQSQPSLLEQQEESEKEKPTREDQEIYQKNLFEKNTISQMGTSKISSDYEMENLNRNQLIQNLEENIHSNLNILQVLQQDQNIEALLDLTQRTLQELKFGQEFSQTKIPVQIQQNNNEQMSSKKLIQLENEVYQKELNFN